MPYLRNIICFLKETLNKDLSTLAKAAFGLLEWRIFWEPHLQEAVSVILSSANDSNWRTRSAVLTYLRIFMHRYGTSYRGFLLHHVLPCSQATDSELAFLFFRVFNYIWNPIQIDFTSRVSNCISYIVIIEEHLPFLIHFFNCLFLLWFT